MKTLALIGASGGVGSDLIATLSDYDLLPLSSKVLDIRDAEAVRDWMANNQPDIVVNLAVRNHDGTVAHLHPEFAEDMISVSCQGLFNLLHYWLRHAKTNGYGRFIHASSVLSVRPVRGAAMYSACKAFGEALITAASKEVAGHDITCNSVRMGYFDAGLGREVPDVVKQAVLAQCGRMGKVSELATVIRTIIETPYINGSALEITGGM